LTNNKSNVKRNGLNIEKIRYENEYDYKLKALEEQIKSNKQDLLYEINDLKNEKMEINKNIKKEMRPKHKIAKAIDIKLEIMFEKMFENEKSVLDRINKKIDVLNSSSSEMYMEEDQEYIDDEDEAIER
jgi:hypothetical protein